VVRPTWAPSAQDVITQVDGQPAVSDEQVTVAELAARSGRPVELACLRGHTTTTVTLVPVRVQHDAPLLNLGGSTWTPRW
jgi:S1-C subfamily serine protease